MDTAEDHRAFHIPVLVREVTNILIQDPDGVYVDATLGGGGHSEAILKKISPKGSVIALDIDEDAIENARNRLITEQNRVRFFQKNFRSLKQVLHDLNIIRVSGIIADLGISSHQIDEPGRGFSFQSDNRLDMRMDCRGRKNARDIVNTYDEKRLAEIFRNYGEEQRSHQIARTIVRERTKKQIDTTGRLASIVSGVVGERYTKKTLARIFQAIRIEVNEELRNLEIFIQNVPDVLAMNGRIGVISYHSLEDRIVKKFFRDEAATVIPSGHKLIPDTPRIPRLRLITRNPITPSDMECKVNPRARSAKFRVAERI